MATPKEQMKIKCESSSIHTRQSEVLVRDDKTSILDEIMNDLSQSNMIIFGVYGSSSYKMADVVSQINKRVERDGLFDAVVIASQKSNENLKGIQEKLGDQLGLQLNEITSEKERARRLCDEIKTKEKILMMLVVDDLKNGIELGEIGIPLGNDHEGCKILLFSQTRELLSHKMKTQKEYSLDDIEPEELHRDSYDYLQSVKQSPESFQLHEVMHEIMTCCGYTPNGNLVSESTKTKLDEIIMALKQPNMRIIGVYGSSYARKRLVVQITKRVVRDGVFDVAPVHVVARMIKKNRCWPWRRQSKSPGLRRIQEELANKLDVQLHDNTSLAERATLLCDTIKTKGNILIFLDDVTGGIDLGAVGIPFGNDHLGSKIMLLSETRDVLSNQTKPMPHREFSVDEY